MAAPKVSPGHDTKSSPSLSSEIVDLTLENLFDDLKDGPTTGIDLDIDENTRKEFIAAVEVQHEFFPWVIPRNGMLMVFSGTGGIRQQIERTGAGNGGGQSRPRSLSRTGNM